MNEKFLQAQIDNLHGKVIASQAAIRALIACHPDPEKAIDTVCEHLDRFAGLALARDLPDELADAVSKAQNALLPNDEELKKART